MAYTLEQITALETAIAQGALSVKYSDKEVTYRSLEEMLKILSIMKGAVPDPDNPSSSVNGGGRRYYGQHSKGL